MTANEKRRFPWGWTLLFGVVFALSMDFWWWDGPVTFGPLTLPRWIYYFVLLQFGFAVAVHFFGTAYWRSETLDDEESPET